ncbi:MAG: LCP family protein [Clostridia bacterium]|nr:LCP family protein [Clostridia bacterium]
MQRIVSLLLALMLMVLAIGAAAAAEYEKGLYDENTAYILNPPTPPEEPEFEHEFINILMLGVDYGVLTPGRGKEDIKNCHTDSVMMIAIDLTDNEVNMISIPRDTLTYVTGAYGVYKLNAAINCASSFEEGIVAVQNTVSWLLGGIRPDHYLVITPHLVEQVGDVIGGLDIDVEMSYFAHSGRTYEKGFQHLDGIGIMDYARARRNATKGNNDYSRTNRQRIVLDALFQKIKSDTDLVYDILDVIVENFDSYFFSDLSVSDLLEMLPIAEGVASGSLNGYEMSGELTMAMKYFNSSFFDQQKRQEIIREVYGVDVPVQRLNSRGYLNYLFKNGFDAVKAIRVGSRVIDWAQKAGFSGETLDNAVEARKNLIDVFSAVDDKLDRDATVKVEKYTGILKKAIADLRDACSYPEKLSWGIVETDKWNMDPDINQYNDIDWN